MSNLSRPWSGGSGRGLAGLRGLLLLALWCLLLPVARPVQAREPVPLPKGLPEIPIADHVVRKVLKNGLTILVVEDANSDIAAMEMLFRVGQVNEDDSIAGITNLIMNILERRVAHQGKDGNTNWVESQGGLLSSRAHPDYASLAVLSDSKHFEGFLGAMAEAIKVREFADDELTEERRKMVELLESDQRLFRAIYEIFLTQFYRYHPYRQPQDGHAASVRQLDRTRLNRYYARFWAPNRTVISIVGKVDRNRVLALLEEKLGSLPQMEEKRLEVDWEPKAVEKELYLSSDSKLAWLFMGFPAPGMKSPDYAPMRILQAILADGLSSRLWVELREKRGLAYELGSIFPQLEGPSHMITYIVTTPEHLRESEDRMDREIRTITKEQARPAELEAAKRRLIGAYLLERETNKGRALQLGLAELLAGGYQYDLQTLSRVRQVTLSDVQRVAKEYLREPTRIVARPRGSFIFF